VIPSDDRPLGEDRRHEDGAGVAIQTDVVVVQHVGGDAAASARL